MMRWRQYLALALSALLVFTAQTLSAARAAPEAAGQIVLCTGTGTRTVDVDAQGHPLGKRPFCPDCLTHYLSALAADWPPSVPRRPRFLPETVRDQPACGLLARIHPVARAPPRGI